MLNRLPRRSTLETRRRRMRAAALVCAVLWTGGPAWAFKVEAGPDWDLRVDTSVRYNAGLRVEAIDPALGNNHNYDETDYRFRRNRLVMNRLDLLSEFDASYRSRFGARLSLAGWADAAYDGNARTNPGELAPGLPYSAIGSYNGNAYSSQVKRYYRGPSGAS